MKQSDNFFVRVLTGIPFPVLIFLGIGVAGALPLIITSAVLIFSDYSLGEELFVVGCGAVFGVVANIVIVSYNFV